MRRLGRAAARLQDARIEMQKVSATNFSVEGQVFEVHTQERVWHPPVMQLVGHAGQLVAACSPQQQVVVARHSWMPSHCHCVLLGRRNVDKADTRLTGWHGTDHGLGVWLVDSLAVHGQVATVVEATSAPMSKRDSLRPLMDRIYKQASSRLCQLAAQAEELQQSLCSGQWGHACHQQACLACGKGECSVMHAWRSRGAWLGRSP